MPKKIIIASKNPVKINAVKTGFEKMFPDQEFVCRGEAAPSGVSIQPLTNKETFIGAVNRTNHAHQYFPDADYWVGIEGGIEKVETEMEAFAWIVIKSNQKMGKAKTGTFYLPPGVVRLINEGKELGEADDIVFGAINSKQKGGAVGLLTGNVSDRTRLYLDAVILALIPFKNPELY